jgi:hypothetical protein
MKELEFKEDQKTGVLAVRLPVSQIRALLQRAKPEENKSDVIKRAIGVFLNDYQ